MVWLTAVRRWSVSSSLQEQAFSLKPSQRVVAHCLCAQWWWYDDEGLVREEPPCFWVDNKRCLMGNIQGLFSSHIQRQVSGKTLGTGSVLVARSGSSRSRLEERRRERSTGEWGLRLQRWKIQGRNGACPSPRAPPSCLRVAGAVRGHGLGCPVCPALLPVSGLLPVLSDGCFSLSAVASRYYLVFHASSAACDRAVLSIPRCLRNLRMKVGRGR